MREDVVLVYHRVTDVQSDRWGLCVTPQRFAEQMDVLGALAPVVPLRELVDEETATGRVAITFDDGYSDNLHSAAPILVNRALPATFFVVSGQMVSPCDFWWDELEELIDPLYERACRVTTGSLAIDVDGRRIVLAGARSADDLYDRVYFPLRSASAAAREAVLSEMWTITAMRRRRRFDAATMNAEQVRTLAGLPGMEIGSHSVTHVSLPGQALPDQQREIRDSRRDLQELANGSVIAFSYPYGAVDDACAACVRASGYAVACTTEARAASARGDAFALPRLWVGNWSADELEHRLLALEGSGRD